MSGDPAMLVLELSIILAAITIGSFVKGVTGTGLPQIAIPVMAVFVGVERAVVIMAIPGIVTNTWLMWAYRRHLRATRDLPALLATGTVGAVLGTIGLQRLDAAVLSFVLAGVILLYVTVSVSRVEVHLPPRLTRVTSPPVGFAAGVLQGSTGISGPLLITYLHGYRLEQHAYVVSLVTLFQVFAVAQMLMLFQLDLYTTSRLVESFVALVPMMLVLPLGARFSHRLSRRAFDLWILAILVGTAGKLFYDGVLGMAS